MIQQGGYGQILGTGGGGGMGVGAKIYQRQRAEVTFARWVQVERLNLERRRLRQMEAQAEANRDLANRRFDLETQRYNFEVRKLESAERQREEQAALAERVYQDKLAQQEYENRRKEEEEARRLQQRQWEMQGEANAETMKAIGMGAVPVDANGALQQDGYVSMQTRSGQRMAIPVKTANAGIDASSAISPRQRIVWDAMDAEVERDGKSLSLLEKKLEKARSDYEALAESVYGAGTGKGRKEWEDDHAREMSSRKSEVDRMAGELESGRAANEAYAEYVLRSKADPTLQADVSREKFKSLPWTGEDAYTPGQRALVMSLVDSDDAKDREILRAVVANGKKKFDEEMTQSYLDNKYGPVAEAIPAVYWVGKDWSDVDDKVREHVKDIMMSKTPSGDAVEAAKELVGMTVQKKQNDVSSILKGVRRYSYGDDGLKVFDADGREIVLMSAERWRSLTDQQRASIEEKMNGVLKDNDRR